MMYKSIKDIRVAFIFKNFALIKNTSVSHIGLGVASFNTSETLKQHGIDAEVWSISDVEGIFAKLEEEHQQHNHHKKPITHIIVSAPWVPTMVLAELTHKYKHIKFTVVSHSGIGFLAADRGGIKLLREEIILQKHMKNFQVAGNSKRFSDWATLTWNDEVCFLPNLYNIEEMKLEKKHWCEDEILKIGCFGAMRPLKNQITAAGAALAIAKELDVPTEFWLNSGRSEGGGVWAGQAIENLVGNIKGFKIKHLPWSPWYDFRKRVGEMDLNLQISYTESFNQVSADSIYESIPVVGSEAITWIPKNWIASVDDALEIADTGIKLLNDKYAAADGQKFLKKYVKDGIKYWKKMLLK